MLGQVSEKTGWTAETANTDVTRQRARPFGPPGQRCRDIKRYTEACRSRASEFRRLSGTSKN